MNYKAIHYVIFSIFQLERCPPTPVLCSIPRPIAREQNEVHYANWHELHTGHIILFYFFPLHGMTPPTRPLPSQCRGFMHTQDTPYSAALLRTSDQPHPQTSTCQHTTPTRQDINVPGRIRTHNPSMRAAVDPRQRPRVHLDQHNSIYFW
jgi:hypothetical protein